MFTAALELSLIALPLIGWLMERASSFPTGRRAGHTVQFGGARAGIALLAAPYQITRSEQTALRGDGGSDYSDHSDYSDYSGYSDRVYAGREVGGKRLLTPFPC